ncbi:cholesteryl ester transfer protein isoform X2 [Cricetulus griseus]|uniref:Cholesteryl ester transfer protein n=1 Tax=Cricetulus griseus TaxID=10029 RepID=A0A9J7K2R9_CRIGR|nr:cholesteryl ester transfer protein isoform X2 [Cricetulus griseus]XP_035312542.1 cholesteryl ester transfer protein isoform X2 [Cricetulus griseus]
MLAVTLLSLALLGSTCACSTSTSYEAGIVCRITKAALLVLNQETAKVIQTAFQRASYPDIKGERSMMLLGRVTYGLHNIQISHLSIASSQVELVEAKSVDVSIQNASVIFKGTLNYGYKGAWGLNIEQSVDFEIESAIDLQINTKLTCDSGHVRTDAPDCSISFHKLLLHLQGEREPGWTKQLFTNIISFTLKMVLKGQVCKEINVISNIMADFVQTRAANIISDRDIEVDISLTRSPIITATYLESHHKVVLETWHFNPNQEIIPEVITGFPSPGQVTVHCPRRPTISCQNKGVVVSSPVVMEFLFPHKDGQDSVTHTFEEDIVATIQASYSKKKLFLSLVDFQIKPKTTSNMAESSESIQNFLQLMITTVGIPEIMSRLEVALTTLMNSKGLDLFDIINPEIITRDGFLLLQMDFGFPEHLLVDFLQSLN